MRKCEIITGLFILSLFTLTGCHKETVIDSPVISIENNLTNSYTRSVLIDDSNHLNDIQGITYSNSKLYVVNKGNDTILVYTTEGEFLTTIGQTGNGQGEFSQPIAIATDMEGNLYIAEEGNKRVQVLTSGGEYLQEYPLDFLNKFKCNISDIEIDKDRFIYISIKSCYSKYAKIYRIDPNGVGVWLGKKLNGRLGKSEDFDTIYFVQTLHLNEKEKSLATSGKSFLSIVSPSEIRKLVTYDNDGYAGSDIVCYKDWIFIYSFGRAQLDLFTKDGVYLETVCDDPTLYEDFYYLCIDDDGNIYATENSTNCIYKYSNTRN